MDVDEEMQSCGPKLKYQNGVCIHMQLLLSGMVHIFFTEKVNYEKFAYPSFAREIPPIFA